MEKLYCVKDSAGNIIAEIKSKENLTIHEVDDKSVDLSSIKRDSLIKASLNLLDVRVGGVSKYDYKAFWLNGAYNWSIVKDSIGTKVLVPTKR